MRPSDSLSLRANKKKPFDFPSHEKSLLTTNYYLKDQYTIAVGNKFERLQADADEQSLNTTYTDFISFHERAAAHVIPLKLKQQKYILWKSHNIKRANLKEKKPP